MYGSGFTQTAAASKTYLLGGGDRVVIGRYLYIWGQQSFDGDGRLRVLPTGETFTNSAAAQAALSPDNVNELADLTLFEGNGDPFEAARYTYALLHGTVYVAPPPPGSLGGGAPPNAMDFFTRLSALSRAALAKPYYELYGLHLKDDIEAQLYSSLDTAPYRNTLNAYHSGDPTEDPLGQTPTPWSIIDVWDLNRGLVAGLVSGAWEAAEGFASFLWSALTNIVETGKALGNALTTLWDLVSDGDFMGAAQMMSPDLYKLITERNSLSNYDKGFLTGKVIGSMAANIGIGTGAAATMNAVIGRIPTRVRSAGGLILEQGQTIIAAIRALPSNMPGVQRLLSRMTSASRNDSIGAYFQARRALHYHLNEGTLTALEFRLGVGQRRGDILLRNGLQIDTKSWRGWGELSPSLQRKRLEELKSQVEDYLRLDGSRLRIEFDDFIPPDVLQFLDNLTEINNYGTRLTYVPIPE